MAASERFVLPRTGVKYQIGILKGIVPSLHPLVVGRFAWIKDKTRRTSRRWRNCSFTTTDCGTVLLGVALDFLSNTCYANVPAEKKNQCKQ